MSAIKHHYIRFAQISKNWIFPQCSNIHSEQHPPPPPPPRVQPLASTHPAAVPPCVCAHPAPVLQHGCWENTSRHFGHVVVHHNAKLFQVRVRTPNHAVTFDLEKNTSQDRDEFNFSIHHQIN